MEISAIYIDIGNPCSVGSDTGAVRATALLALISDPPGPVFYCLSGQSMMKNTVLFSNFSPAGPDRNTDYNITPFFYSFRPRKLSF